MYLRECLFGIAVLCGCATPAGAQSPETLSWAVRPAAPAQAPPGDEPLVGLDELIQAAIEHSPAIAAARHRVDAARQRIGEEHALPDPMVSVGYNGSGNPLPGAGLGTEPTANIGLMVTQHIPYPGKRDLRAADCRPRSRRRGRPDRLGASELTARVKHVYYRLAYVASAEAVLTRNKQLLDTLLNVAESRYSVGRAAQQDVIKAQTELTLLELRIERLRQERCDP